MSPDNEIVHRTIGGAIRNFDLLDANSITFDVPLNVSFQHSFFFFFFFQATYTLSRKMSEIGLIVATG